MRNRTSQNPSTKPVLVVNDDPQILRIFRRHLEKHGIEFEKANTGGRALYQLEKHDYQLVFFDLVLSDMDGLELYHKLESENRLPDHTKLFFLVDTSSASELKVFNRIDLDREIHIISRSALQSKLSEILPAELERKRPSISFHDHFT